MGFANFKLFVGVVKYKKWKFPEECELDEIFKRKQKLWEKTEEFSHKS